MNENEQIKSWHMTDSYSKNNINVTNDMSTKLLSLNEVCEQLGIGHFTVYQLLNKNSLRSVKIGARRLVPYKALQDFVNKLKEEYGA